MRRGCMMLGLVFSLLVVGCGREEPITRYKVPRVAQEDPKEAPIAPFMNKKGKAPTVPVPARMLGAIFSHDDKTWFIRVHGPVKTITDLEKDFDTFVRSIRMDKDAEPISWTLPRGWVRQPGGGFRYATLHTGGEDSLEIVVSHLSRKENEPLLKENLDRWRTTFLNMPELGPGDVEKFTRPIDVNGIKMLWVEMDGIVQGKGKMPAGHPPIATKLPFKADLPATWTAQADSEEGLISIDRSRGGDIILVRLKDKGGDWQDVLPGIAPELVRKVGKDRLIAGQKTMEIGGKKVPAAEFAVEDMIKDKKVEMKFFLVQYPVGADTWCFILFSSPEPFEASKGALLAFLPTIRPEEPRADLPKGK